MTDNIMEIQGIIREFPTNGGTVRVLKDISAEFPRGKLTILKGRSGSGKTTLLNILGALDRPTRGTVLFDGRDISHLSDSARTLIRRYETGYVFQSVALVPMMTAAENVDLALRLSKYKGDRAARVHECLRLVGLDKRASHLPQELSGGEQQRIAIARAISHKPKVIFADEPTGALDTDSGLRVVKLFKELIRAEGISIIMTTHDPGLMEIGDRVYEIKDGEIDHE